MYLTFLLRIQFWSQRTLKILNRFLSVTLSLLMSLHCKGYGCSWSLLLTSVIHNFGRVIYIHNKYSMVKIYSLGKFKQISKLQSWTGDLHAWRNLDVKRLIQKSSSKQHPPCLNRLYFSPSTLEHFSGRLLVVKELSPPPGDSLPNIQLATLKCVNVKAKLYKNSCLKSVSLSN